MKHSNVAIFIPHSGCPNKCSFCEQNSITGKSLQPTLEDVKSIIELSIKNLGSRVENTEIAFFGGSFTAIDKKYMNALLDLADKYVKEYSFAGIRISTRPDAIDNNILDVLKSKSVTSIELGAQSMDDRVLELNRRGHKKEDVIFSSKLIKEKGFSLGLQMMTGLYGSNSEIDYDTGKQIVKLKPDTVRIYPTVTMRNTLLHKLYNEKKYFPMTFDETVEICSKLLILFEENNIRVIRLGLHYMKSLDENAIAGVWHPSFREICESRNFLNKITQYISSNNVKHNVIILVNTKNLSKVIGNNKYNIKELNKMGYDVKVKKDDNLGEKDLIIKSF